MASVSEQDQGGAFFAAAVKQLAKSLASLRAVSLDKVNKLIQLCPVVSRGNGQHVRVDRRSLSALGALGQFLFLSKLQHCEVIVAYLERLLAALHDFDRILWQEGNEMWSDQDGLLAEDMAFMLTLLLSEIAMRVSAHQSEIGQGIYHAISALVQRIHSEDIRPGKFCCGILPCLLGMVRALSGSHRERSESFRELFGVELKHAHARRIEFRARQSSITFSMDESAGENEVWDIRGTARRRRPLSNEHTQLQRTADSIKRRRFSGMETQSVKADTWSIHEVQRILRTVLPLLEQNTLDRIDHLLAEYRLKVANFMYESFSDELLFAVLALARDLLAPHQPFATKSFANDLNDTASHIFASSHCLVHLPRRSSTSDLTNGPTSSFAQLQPGSVPYVSRIDGMAAALDIMVWSSTSESAADSSLLRLVNLLTVSVSPRLDFSHLPLRFAAIWGLGTLSETHPHVSAMSLDALRDFLVGPSPLLARLYELSADKLSPLRENTLSREIPGQRSFIRKLAGTKKDEAQSEIFSLICAHAMENICRCLHASLKSNPDCVEAFISPLANKLYTLETAVQAEMFDLVAKNLTCCLAWVAVSFQNIAAIGDNVLNAFQQRLGHPPSKVDAMIIEQLGRVLLIRSGHYLPRVMEIFTRVLVASGSATYGPGDTKISRRYTLDYRHCSSMVYSTLESIADHLTSNEVRHDILLRVLELFVQQALEGKKHSEKASATSKATSQSFQLGLLLPVMAKLLGKQEVVIDQRGRILKLFLDFWQFAVIYGFGVFNSTIWPMEWTLAVQQIAVKSPHLLSGAEYLTRELMHNSVLKNEHIAPLELNDLRQSLRDLLSAGTDLEGYIGKLLATHCTYVLSIYHLEMVRVTMCPSTVIGVFVYLEDRGIIRDKGGLLHLVSGVADVVFRHYLDLMAERPVNQHHEEELEDVATYLLVQFNNRIEKKVYRMADTFFSSMAEKFPHILWNRQVIFTLLDLLQALSQAMSDEAQSGRSFEMVVPRTDYKMVIPEEMEARVQIVKDFGARCGDILRAGVKLAPHETRQQLLDYILQPATAAVGLVRHAGVSLVAEVLLETTGVNMLVQSMAPSAVEKLPSCVTRDASSLTSLMGLISKHMGEVTGMRSVLQSSTANVDVALSKLLLGKLSDAELCDNQEEYMTAMFRLAALFIFLQGVERSLLHRLVWSPVRIFTTGSMTTAVACWRWIIAARPEVELSFFRVMCSAWKWTIDNRIGLFTANEQPTASVLSFKHVERTVADVAPHDIWIQFLVEHFEAIKTRSAAEVEMLASLLHQSLSLFTPRHRHDGAFVAIVRHVSAAGARFRLLQLGLSLVQSSHVPRTFGSSLLRQKIYTTALDYFSMTPTWPTQPAAALRQDINVMIKVWHMFLSERKHLKDSLVKIDVDNTVVTYNTSVDLDTQLQRGWLNTVPLASGKSTRRPGSGRVDSSLDLTGQSVKSEASSMVKNMQKRRILLLSLLRQEIERLSSWHNPLSSPDLSFKNEEEVLSWNLSTITPKHWVDCCNIAWQISPHLAVQLATRLGSVEVIRRRIPLLILTNPGLVANLEDALHLFVSDRVVASDAPELVHLLCWADAPAISVLTFFSNLLPAHMLTAQYTVRVLRSCPVDEVLYYIPQLVQAVRYDKLGYVREFITWAAKKSQLLAHQLIWNMKTNMFMDEDAERRDPDIYNDLEQLVERIKGDLSGPALKFYQREFELVEKITAVSGEIRPFPKGPERKQACLKELAKINPPPGVYLPSNPEAVVTAIDYNSGQPMSSAAKAPYLAKFKVQRCGIEELEKLNEKIGEDDASPSCLDDSKAYWQACIFKVGDDVRQDMLALQVIDMFRRVFDAIDLPMFMFPYRVVATAPGCGVIECVPDSKSRDQLGQETEATLYEYFVKQYGRDHSASFQEARRNFVTSMAAYSLLTFMLQIKDRHNGNIMLDKKGHIIHIDFGFMFESSPGGNLGFEPHFKLTQEMVELMGDDEKAVPFRVFKEMCVRGYLAIKTYHQQLISLVALMLDTGLPCFRGQTLELLRNRLQPNQPDRAAANFMIKVVQDSYLNYRTKIYDMLQFAQNEYYY